MVDLWFGRAILVLREHKAHTLEWVVVVLNVELNFGKTRPLGAQAA